jgi:hypothetical protein
MEDQMKNKVASVCTVALFILAVGVIAQAQASAKVAGTWTVSNMGRSGTVTSTLTITQDAAKITGTMKPQQGDAVQLENATVNGNSITFTVTRMGRGGEVKVQYTGTVDGDNMKGTFQAGQNSVDWTAKRS